MAGLACAGEVNGHLSLVGRGIHPWRVQRITTALDVPRIDSVADYAPLAPTGGSGTLKSRSTAISASLTFMLGTILLAGCSEKEPGLRAHDGDDRRAGPKERLVLGLVLVAAALGLLAIIGAASAPADYTAALHYWTGSKEHYATLVDRARSQGVLMSAEGLRGPKGKALKVGSEGEIYRRLGLEYIAPELRENQGEIEAAAVGSLPETVVAEDIQGMVHCHTTYSDGQNTIEEMARAAEAMGMQYITFTDHSPTASYAGGVKIDRLRAQWEEIDRVQERLRIKLLKGTESDILEYGLLDYPDYILEKFDVIIASIHARHKMNADQMTDRLLRALKLPLFKIWGHPLGRLIESRPPFECRMDEVLDAVAASRAAIEVNGDPRRLDLEPRWIRAARQRGIKFVVSTDAHSLRNLENLPYGVAMARRGWLSRGDILNTLPVDEFMDAVRP